MAGRLVHRLDLETDRLLVDLGNSVETDLDGLHIGFDQVRLGAEHFLDETADDTDIEPGQPGHGTDIGHVLHQHTGARIVELGIAQTGQRHANGTDIGARMQVRTRPGIVVEEIAARGDFLEILGIGLGIHGDHELRRPGPRHMAVLGQADFIPGRQALDVGREQVLAHHGHAHAEDRLHQETIGRGRPGPVHIGDLDDEVVHTHIGLDIGDNIHSAATPLTSSSACGMKMSASCMSQAEVGQRSAHRPQCRHKSSSLTMTRPVSLSGSDT